MKELKDIIKAFDKAQQLGLKTALATVVHVEGSSYRRPGARMLVTEDGKLTGAISGGCLEGDALRKALSAINEGKNKLVTYDTTDDDDAKFGIQLGCNGIVHILFEPITAANPNNPIQLLKALTSRRQKGVIITLFNLDNPFYAQPGTCLLHLNDASKSCLSLSQDLRLQVLADATQAFQEETSAIKSYTLDDGILASLFDFVSPALSLVILGAGNDAIPLAEMAHLLGWQITVIDGRPNYATRQRFPKADKVFVARPEEVVPQLEIDQQTAFVLMSHNYNYDLKMLKFLVREDATYIGMLGPKSKLSRMIAEFENEGNCLSPEDHQKIYGPVGLDIGAETAEEIALSVLAEIKTIFASRICQHLRDKTTSIHAPTLKVSAQKEEDFTFQNE
ncbi:XdhC family protein [Desertivirga xinjiangensis]|uniref:XdhC family protein n=1 Tax=Desertivirga xinjiangensis TaxID=539206 RepID=UPI00210BC7B6|nr:XdhC/CoxI family protein [Pedobacter xinjiangensis]